MSTVELAVGGVRVGHWTDAGARTGCSVVLLPEGTVGSCEVRGGAPASRELDLLDPRRMVQRVDAVLLAGGSAFGLAAADGVMRWCEERGVGFPTTAGPVPIVPALALYDLAVGDGRRRPEAVHGYEACVAARAGEAPIGLVGAGAGATIGKWRGREHARPAGLGGAVVAHGGATVLALVAVNAYGERRDSASHDELRIPAARQPAADVAFGNTTIGVLVTDARLTKVQCRLVAESGHDGMARALAPVHTGADGDALIACATGVVPADLDAVRTLAAAAVERAIRSVA